VKQGASLHSHERLDHSNQTKEVLEEVQEHLENDYNLIKDRARIYEHVGLIYYALIVGK